MRSMLAALRVPQSTPLPGQVPNSAGGHAWPVTDRVRMERFLILGTEGGSYYATARALTVENAEAVLNCLAAEGPRAVDRIVTISTSGRAPKNDPSVFALALALKLGDPETRRAAVAAVPAVCRTGTHLFHLAEAVNTLGGWGRGTKRAFASWYAEKSPRELALQLVKYRQRDGWTHRDVLRLAKPKGAEGARNALYRWAARGVIPEGGFTSLDPELALVDGAAAAQLAEGEELRELIEHYRLPWEALRTEQLADADVWRSLVRAGALPMGALLRNLGRLAAKELLTSGSDVTHLVAARLRDPKAVRGAKLHPLSVLAALTTYRSGHGARGKLSWRPVPPITEALEAAFHAAFAAVPSTRRRWMLGLDVSGSMGGGTLAGFPGLSPRVGSAAMAMVTMRSEPSCHVVAFTAGNRVVKGETAGLTTLDLEGADLATIVDRTSRLAFGPTDCALPMRHAEANRIPVDVFVIYTDSETWHGPVHPAAALRSYRKAMRIPAKLVVVGMVSNGFSIADPKDAGMLDVVGFDAGAPAAIAAFVQGFGG